MSARFVCFLLFCGSLFAQQSQPSLTIYNQDFAVVRQDLPLDLKSGENQFNMNDITMHLEPDSVILRDPSGKHSLQVLEQNYRADPVSQMSLLSLYEGRTIDFELPDHSTLKGKVIRSGYVRPDYFNPNNYGAGAEEPIIEVGGQLRFGLPGTPVFPDLTAETILKPRLEWLIATDKPGKFPAEFSYITGGMSWQADYNIVAPEKGDVVDIVGWVTIDNRTGKAFENAHIKLMAGDVNKIQGPTLAARAYKAMGQNVAVDAAAPVVREKAFDEFHLYTLQRPTTLRDQETKQVEFVSSTGIHAQRLFIYDGAQTGDYGYYSPDQIRNDPNYGTASNKKIWVMEEFKNSEANHLGIALPKGKLRFYRRDTDGHLEFVGENAIDHTPKDETLRIYTGNAFDVVGERKRTNYRVDSNQRWMDESFEIRIRNHKKEAVEVRAVEHLYRWTNWKVTEQSSNFSKKDAQTIEFPVTVAPNSEQVITYTVHYSW